MYQTNFVATNSADWAQAIQVIDADTNQPLELTGLTFELRVEDDCGSPMVSASTDEATITTPGDGVVQWVFTHEQMGGFCSGNTYKVGLTMTSAGGTTQILIGSLSYLDGVVL